MSLSHTSVLKHLRLITVVFGALLFALILASSARDAHAAFVQSGTITLCHEGSGATNTWNSLAVAATIPSGSFGVSFQAQTATACTATPGAFSGHTWTVTNATAQDLSAFTTPSKALFIQIKLTGDGTNTPVLNSATLVDTPGTTDTTPPTVTLATLSGNQSNTVTLSATASDNTGGSGVAKVDFYEASGTCNASGSLIGTDTTSPYSTSWNTTTLSDGTYNVCAIATDGAGNPSTVSSQAVTVSNTVVDTSPPTSTLSSPGTGSLSGPVTLSASAADTGSGVAKVDFYDVISTGTCSAGSTLIGTDTTGTSGTYSVSWNTASVANNTYKICSIATDNVGLVQTTPSLQTVTVNNVTTVGSTTFLTPTAGATVTPSASTTVKVNTQNYSPAVKSVAFKDGSTTIGTDTTGTSDASGGNDWSVTWNTSSLSGSHTLTATATDSGNTVQPPASITVTVSGSDTIAPTAPGSLAASAPSATDVHLSWTASTDNVGVAGYRIFRNGSATALTTTTATTFDDTTVSGSTNYSYTVKAFDAAGNVSTASNTASVSTPCAGDCVAPSAPSGLTGSASLVGTTAVKVSLSWAAATDNVGVTGYIVLRAGVVLANNVTPTSTTTSYTDTAVQPNTNYSYTVEAKDAAGNVSPQSNTFSVTTPQLPNVDNVAPTVPQSVSAIAASSTQVNLTWNASTDNVGVDHYVVLRDGTQVGTTAATSFGDGTVAASTTYNYTVKAADAAGNISAASTVAQVTTPPQVTGDTSIPVYRLSTPIGGHFWTSDAGELTYCINTLHYQLEGVGYNAFSTASSHTPVYRLATPREQLSGGHFWTDSTAELNYVIANLGYQLEGVAFKEDSSQLTGDVPVYRLSIPAGGHFWTNSQAEVTFVEQNLGYVMEGIAWYAPAQ